MAPSFFLFLVAPRRRDPAPRHSSPGRLANHTLPHIFATLFFFFHRKLLITQTPHSFHLNPNKLSPKPKDLSRVPSPNTRGIGDKSYVGSGARPQGTLGLAPG